MEVIATGEEILKYIPQRAPMVMVSDLHHADEKSALTGLRIEDQNLFVDHSLFTEPGIVEHIAQSIALQAGYGFIKAGKNVPVGYIAAVKNLTINYLPEVNQELTTRVEVINNVMNVVLVSAEVKCHDQQVATCEMRVFIKE
ncbi:MAG: hydroxymyristoyl-ACP dehydratase [Azospira oryzae]|nr:MAG: hydroxymyristoyl-ACP dehydratase [Azospira oryzae]